MKRHMGLIRGMCAWHATGGAVECADLVQDVLAQLWHYRDRLRQGATLLEERAWVRYHCRSVFSHRRRHGELPTVSLDEEMAVADEHDTSGETLKAMAAVLNEREHELLELLLDGYSIAEIAKRLRMKERSVSMMKYRMIMKMRGEKCG